MPFWQPANRASVVNFIQISSGMRPILDVLGAALTHACKPWLRFSQPRVQPASRHREHGDAAGADV
jgi:hypothetical protein